MRVPRLFTILLAAASMIMVVSGFDFADYTTPLDKHDLQTKTNNLALDQIYGTDNPALNCTNTYYIYPSISPDRPNTWDVTGGYITSQTNSGTIRYVSVVFTDAGPQTILFESGTFAIDLEVTAGGLVCED